MTRLFTLSADIFAIKNYKKFYILHIETSKVTYFFTILYKFLLKTFIVL